MAPISFEKKTWQDENVQYPNRYQKSGETAFEVTLIRDVGIITHQNPLSAAEFNRIEQGIKDAVDELESINNGAQSVGDTEKLNGQEGSYYLARANHTGTQTSSTISDFGNAVRAIALAGLSLVVSTVILSTDSILVALGKLQAQITGIKDDLNIVQPGTMSITAGSWIASSGLVYKDFTVSGISIGIDDDADIIPQITTNTLKGYWATLGYQYATRQGITTIRVYASADPGGSIPCSVRLIADKGGVS